MSEVKRIAFLVAAEGIEKAELVEPWAAVEQADLQPVLISPQEGKVQLFDHLDKADTQPVDLVVSEAKVEDFSVLVLPGGVANPDQLRTNEDAVEFVREFVESGKPVAAICHAPWWRLTSSGASGSPPGPACGLISETRAVSGLTSRWWSTGT